MSQNTFIKKLCQKCGGEMTQQQSLTAKEKFRCLECFAVFFFDDESERDFSRMSAAEIVGHHFCR